MENYLRRSENQTGKPSAVARGSVLFEGSVRFERHPERHRVHLRWPMSTPALLMEKMTACSWVRPFRWRKGTLKTIHIDAPCMKENCTADPCPP